jgi:hypothetical protein
MRALEAFGAGCAAFDGDNDGWQDVLLVTVPHPTLFHNHEGTRFQDISTESGLTAIDGDWKGCAIGDLHHGNISIAEVACRKDHSPVR